MSVDLDANFPLQLLNIGNGILSHNGGYISVDENIGTIVHTMMDDLISNIYPEISQLLQKPYERLCERNIPRNISVFGINNMILEKIEGQNKEHRSVDSVINTEDAVQYPPEFLNSLNPAGFPTHNLDVKMRLPTILLRNLNPPRLCNSTRLQIKTMRNYVIEASILTAPVAGEFALIPPIPISPTDLTFQFKKLQFPVKLSFVITINKA
ncbi:uncharacterized protein LOC142319878 [Lycorma delicatula]|uniref:uncharacterized protein LOC142319878 n=1 Tax=Lycorma delicatula TaxID=130591 RepID=UPI003F515DB8